MSKFKPISLDLYMYIIPDNSRNCCLAVLYNLVIFVMKSININIKLNKCRA